MIQIFSNIRGYLTLPFFSLSQPTTYILRRQNPFPVFVFTSALLLAALSSHSLGLELSRLTVLYAPELLVTAPVTSLCILLAFLEGDCSVAVAGALSDCLHAASTIRCCFVVVVVVLSSDC